jgi:hypothetical protein
MKRRWFLTSAAAILVVVAGFLLLPGSRRERPASGFLGIEFTPLTRAAQARAPYLTGGGALIAKVVPGSPADKAHLAQGEIVTQIDGAWISSASDAANRLRLRAGARVTLAYLDLKRGDGHIRRVSAVLSPDVPPSKTVFSVLPPPTLAKEWNFEPRMAAGASWSNGIARGAVDPLPLETYARGRCSGLAPDEWTIVDSAKDGTSFGLVSPVLRVRAVFAIVTVGAGAAVGDAVQAAIARFAGVKPQSSPPTTTEDGDQVVEFGSEAGYAGFALYHVRPTWTKGLVLSVWIAAVPASNVAELVPLAGAVALSIRCSAELSDPHRPYDDTLAPTSVSERCIKNDCDETDFAGAYNSATHTGYVHSARAENFLIDPRKDIWETGPNGPGTYRQVAGMLEKLEPGRSN